MSSFATVSVGTHEQSLALIAQAASRLSAADCVSLAFFLYASVAAFVFPVPDHSRVLIVALNLLASAVIVALSQASGAMRESSGGAWRPGFLGSLRIWFPCVLILLAYRESGLFVRPDVTHQLDFLFVRWDRLLVQATAALNVPSSLGHGLADALEISYLFCYPQVPLGVAAIVLGLRRGRFPSAAEAARALDRFWTPVLLAVLASYALFPFFPLTPPRQLFHDLPVPVNSGLLRSFNLWILAHYGVEACVFPSGHVAAATATALAVRAYRPRLGWVFLAAAQCVAVATVYLRYHYAADATAGGLLAWGAFLVSNRLDRRRTGAAVK